MRKRAEVRKLRTDPVRTDERGPVRTMEERRAGTGPETQDGRGPARIAEERRGDSRSGRRVFRAGWLLAVSLVLTLVAGEAVSADPAHSQVASAGETAKSSQVGSYGMLPIYPRDIEDGTYDVTVESSSRFFRIHDGSLTVKNGEMSVRIRLDSASYELVYAGSGAEAAAAPASDYLTVSEDDEGWSVFEMPVTSLDAAFPCAAFSKKKQKWYDRTLLIEASSLPSGALHVALPDYEAIRKAFEAEGVDPPALADSSGPSEAEQTAASGSEGAADGQAGGLSGGTDSRTGALSGEAQTGGTASWKTASSGSSEPEPVEMETYPDGSYSVEVSLTGGSGRASVSSPALLTVKNGLVYATLVWSSSYYDYMRIGGERYDNENDGGASTFTIPVTAFDEPVAVTADTTAMGDPVEIRYQICFYYDTIGSADLIPQMAARKVLRIAAVIIAAGAVLSFLTRKMRYR